jgi:hypothetical protein
MINSFFIKSLLLGIAYLLITLSLSDAKIQKISQNASFSQKKRTFASRTPLLTF